MVGLKLQELFGNSPNLLDFAANVDLLSESRRPNAAFFRGGHHRLNRTLPRTRAVRGSCISTLANYAVLGVFYARLGHLRNKPRLKLAPGYNRRDLIKIGNVIRVDDWIINQNTSFTASDAIDVGSGKKITFRDAVKHTKQISGASTYLDFGTMPYSACEPMIFIADTSRIKCTGLRPKYSLVEALTSMLIKLAS
jgi:nucleoside-diphosphate-sugar epimerase